MSKAQCDKSLLNWDFQHTGKRNPFEAHREQHSGLELLVENSTAELKKQN